MFDLTHTKSRMEAAAHVRDLRDQGATWAAVREEMDVSESTGRKLLKELAEYEAKRSAVVAEKVLADDDAAAKAREALKADPKPAAKPRSGSYAKATCKCGTIIRLGHAVLAAETVACNVCGQVFAAA